MTITWLRWQNPLHPPAEEMELEEQSAKDEWGPRKVGPTKLMVGPAGVLPLAEHNDPSKLMDLWVGHADFDITESIAEAIAQVPGVELLRVWTRYRFWLGVAKRFDSAQVRQAIDELFQPEAKPSQLDLLKTRLSKSYAHWFIARKSGKLSIHGGDDVVALKRRAGEMGPDVEIIPSW